MIVDTLTEVWRTVNFLFSLPLLAAMWWVARKEWKSCKVDERLFIMGTMILVLAGCLGSIVAIVSSIEFNALGTPLFSIAGCWLTFAVALRITRLRREDTL